MILRELELAYMVFVWSTNLSVPWGQEQGLVVHYEERVGAIRVRLCVPTGDIQCTDKIEGAEESKQDKWGAETFVYPDGSRGLKSDVLAMAKHGEKNLLT